MPGLALDADVHVHVHDGGRFQQFRGRFLAHEMVVDNGQAPDALDPGVHDEMSGRFAALGVGVVDVVVEGELIPGLGHFQEMVLGQQATHHPGLAGHGGPEIMGQFQLAAGIGPGAHELLHDLEQDPGSVFFQPRFGRHHHLVAQAAQGREPIAGQADFEGTEQVDGGIGNAQALRRGHFLDAVGVEIRRQETA